METLESLGDGQVFLALVRKDHGNDPPQLHSFRHLTDEVYIKYIAHATHVSTVYLVFLFILYSILLCLHHRSYPLIRNVQRQSTYYIAMSFETRQMAKPIFHITLTMSKLRDAVAVLRRAHNSLTEKRQLEKEGTADSVSDIKGAPASF